MFPILPVVAFVAGIYAERKGYVTKLLDKAKALVVPKKSDDGTGE